MLLAPLAALLCLPASAAPAPPPSALLERERRRVDHISDCLGMSPEVVSLGGPDGVCANDFSSLSGDEAAVASSFSDAQLADFRELRAAYDRVCPRLRSKLGAEQAGRASLCAADWSWLEKKALPGAARRGSPSAAATASGKAVSERAESLAKAGAAGGLAGSAAASTALFGERDERLRAASSGAVQAPAGSDDAKRVELIGRKAAAWISANESALKKAYDAELARRVAARRAKGEGEKAAFDAVFEELSPFGPSVLAWELEDDFPRADAKAKEAFLARIKGVLALKGAPSSAAASELVLLLARHDARARR